MAISAGSEARVTPPPVAPVFAEDIRLLIWDLDDTFWDGTLTEGGIRYREDTHRLVIELARRGIMSAICSKNDFGTIETLLRGKGIWDHFIFPSIDWSPKGHRIRAMLDAIGFRAPSALFLDDNPLNLAEAAHANPGLNVAQPEVIPALPQTPQLRGRDDPDMRRLAQYKVKERKARAAADAGGDTTAFLRRSDIRVALEYDVEAHLDRAIELINRTNQLNFTKARLPENSADAARRLTEALRLNTTDAALVRVRDAFGDYGFAGFYMTRRVNNARRLEHFCFSCRTLNMGVEHWVYAHLGQPELSVVGEVLSDVQAAPVRADWITPERIGDGQGGCAAPLRRFARVFARGGCDLASLMHYVSLHAGEVIEEFNEPRAGQMFRRDHSAFLLPALTGGLSPEQMRAAEALGYGPAEFATALPRPADRGDLVFLSFWADADIPLYRHRASGLRVPYWLVGAQHHDLIARADLRAAVAKSVLQERRLATLAAEYDHEGRLPAEEMRARYRTILDALGPDATVVLVLANERGPATFRDPDAGTSGPHRRLNEALREVASGRSNVALLDPADEIRGPEDLIDLNHFRRDVYHRLYRRVMERLPGGPTEAGTG